MPQNLTDLRERHPAIDHLGGHGVAQAVWPDLRHPCPHAGAADDRAHPTAAQSHDRRLHAQEDFATGRLRAAVLQPGGDRFADVDWQGQSTVTASFAMDHRLGSPPIKVIELERCYLGGTQPQAEQHDNHCVVASPDVLSAVAGVQQCVGIP